MCALLAIASAGCDDGEDTDAGPAATDSGPGDVDSGPGQEDAGAGDTDAGPGDSDSGPGAADGGPAGAAHCGEGNLIIQAVEPGTSITLFNPTVAPIAIESAWRLCGQRRYSPVDSLTTDTSVPAGGTVTLSWPGSLDSTPAAGELALYSSTSYGAPAAVLDYICWGTPMNDRKVTAETGGEWSGDCAASITGGALTREPNSDGTSAASYDPAGGSAALACP